jgi:hypothetical protein
LHGGGDTEDFHELKQTEDEQLHVLPQYSIAFALTHGSVLWEYAWKEVNSTTLDFSWAKPRETMESEHDTRTRIRLKVMVERVVPILAGLAILVTCGLRGMFVFMAGRASHSGEVFWALFFLMAVTVFEVLDCRPRYGKDLPAFESKQNFCKPNKSSHI